ncbi:Uncharacterised protein [Corynebacterium matruchotii]|nr:Uncharacterised protein [Corynebacterium matruchotii]
MRELPPRARRILGSSNPTTRVLGTTSACAENTTSDKATSKAIRNYLRVRGEYSWLFSTSMLKMELPPRARRILIANETQLVDDGTTSACAENTDSINTMPIIGGNYLRVRGEYPK